jgi:hypothetical protein
MLPVTLPADDAAMSALEWPMLCAACGTTETVLHWKLGHASHVQGMCKACATCMLNPWHLEKTQV